MLNLDSRRRWLEGATPGIGVEDLRMKGVFHATRTSLSRLSEGNLSRMVARSIGLISVRVRGPCAGPLSCCPMTRICTKKPRASRVKTVAKLWSRISSTMTTSRKRRDELKE